MQTFLLIAVPIVLGVSGQLLLKTGITQVGKFAIMTPDIFMQFIRIFCNPFVFSGFVCYGFASLIWIITLSRVPLSLAYPMFSINYVLIVLASRYFFGEDVNLIRWMGVGVICIGVLLISRS